MEFEKRNALHDSPLKTRKPFPTLIRQISFPVCFVEIFVLSESLLPKNRLGRGQSCRRSEVARPYRHGPVRREDRRKAARGPDSRCMDFTTGLKKQKHLRRFMSAQ